MLLLDSPCPANMPALPVSIADYIYGNPALAPAKMTPHLAAHFKNTVDSHTGYDPEPFGPSDPKRPKTFLVTAQEGIGGGREDVKDYNVTVAWLMDSRANVGTNGWENLLGDAIEVVRLDGANHFTIVQRPWVSRRLFSIARFVFSDSGAYTGGESS
jgi:hypothetical protein